MSEPENGLQTALSNSIAQLAEKAFSGALSNTKEAANWLNANFALDFEKYVVSTTSRCSNVKTLLNGDDPVPLRKAYEPVDLEFKSRNVPIAKFIENVVFKNKNALITATLGSGKSLSMKFLYTEIATSKILSKIPIFVELRYVNFPDQTIYSYIHQQISPFSNFVSEKSIVAGLKAGIFTLLLDGFDEIRGENRKSAQRQIIEIAEKYPASNIIVSSRLDVQRFISWHQFPEYHVSPLTKQKMINMIKNIEYNQQEKEQFLKLVNDGLFETHGEILSNPLLASMMLLTFKEFQEIPSKMHVFYRTAFDVMYRRHDSTKTDYQRQFKSDLDIEEFRHVFMTFCFMSFIDKRFTFNRELFEQYLRKSLDYENHDTRVSDYGEDVVDNLCIIHCEGEKYDFIHRSFQEYFAALFLSKRSVESSYDFIDAIVCEHEDGGECIGMMVEMDSEEFERKYLIRKLDAILSESKKATSPRKKIELLSNHFVLVPAEVTGRADFLLYEAPLLGRSYDKLHKMIRSIGRLYYLPIYNVRKYASEGWIDAVPRKHKGKDVIILLDSGGLTLNFIRKLGLVRYYFDIISAIRELHGKLLKQHRKKKKMLSNTLLNSAK